MIDLCVRSLRLETPSGRASHGAAALALVTALCTVTGSARAEAPPGAAPPAATPSAAEPAPKPAGPAAPAAEAPPSPTASPAEQPGGSHASSNIPDSDEEPAVPAPDASLTASDQARRSAATRPGPAVPDDPSRMDDGLMGTHQEHWLIGAGFRSTFVSQSGFDPFSTNNLLPQISIDAGRAFYSSGPFSLAGLVVFDAGAVTATARGADTSLNVYRVTAGAEGRYHLWRRFYLFGRVAPGALYSNATLKDRVAAVERHSNSWAFTSDFSAGAAVEFAGEQRGASTRPRGWLGLDGGYGWAQTTKLVFESDGSEASAPARLEPIRLGDLAVRGGFFRVNGTMTF